jgi:hypothetical protein
MPGNVEIDGMGLTWDVDAAELVKFWVRWRNWSNVSPEGSLNRFPDSTKGVRQFNGLIGASSVGSVSIARQCIGLATGSAANH